MALAFPPIYLLPTHISLESLHELEDQIPTLTYDITEATVVLGKVTTKQRAQFELRNRDLWTAEVVRDNVAPRSERADGENLQRKRRKVDGGRSKDLIVVDSSTESEDGTAVEINRRYESMRETPESTQSQDSSSSPAAVVSSQLVPNSGSSVALQRQDDIEPQNTVKVVKLAWFTDSVAAGRLYPIECYLVYEGKRVSRPEVTDPEIKKTVKRPRISENVPGTAMADASKAVSTSSPMKAYTEPSGHKRSAPHSVTRPTHLLHETTSEHEDLVKLPPIPDFLDTIYSCQRPTPLYSPNDSFITQLKKIKHVRILTGDEIGVRAYSTAIATIATYPYTLTTPQEILHLPGCDQKIALLYQEWKETGHIQEAEDLESDTRLQVLNLFYGIWGVGATTAREFYAKGWRDLDDVVESGWDTLSRVQQIGVKYYDEFQLKIPRSEVEYIGEIILKNINKVHPGWHQVIVGSHRRGKPESGDVDVILSHPNENVTIGAVQDIVEQLERGEWITHTLILSTSNSERGQTPVSWKGASGKKGTGFDTLDKALVVWQDPSWPTRSEDLEKNAKAKNPNVHRRVDIIISPWKTAGCAVLGWTSGTTFQRDLRRYCKKIKNLKFDSSGIRSQKDGHWVDLEKGEETRDLVVKEKRVFAGLGLEWREPWERCTG